MSKSFIQECQEMANTLNNQKYQIYVKDWHKKYSTKMFELTDKYHKDLNYKINYKSKQGIRELYYNFNRDDFKFNLPETGNPAKMCAVWLKHICTPQSMYLCTNYKDGEFTYRDHFHGLHFDVWNNKAFTVHFTW